MRGRGIHRPPAHYTEADSAPVGYAASAPAPGRIWGDGQRLRRNVVDVDPVANGGFLFDGAPDGELSR